MSGSLLGLDTWLILQWDQISETNGYNLSITYSQNFVQKKVGGKSKGTKLVCLQFLTLIISSNSPSIIKFGKIERQWRSNSKCCTVTLHSWCLYSFNDNQNNKVCRLEIISFHDKQTCLPTFQLHTDLLSFIFPMFFSLSLSSVTFLFPPPLHISLLLALFTFFFLIQNWMLHFTKS